ncbi:MAG: hypothetical protein KJI69_06105, partial [Patescibacteria group bacterium]|nr:hypothetical protein [Patescibacteria group bacterium]
MALALKESTNIINQFIDSKQIETNICDTDFGHSLPLYKDDVVKSPYLDIYTQSYKNKEPLIP